MLPVDSLAHMLQYRAREAPDQLAFTFEGEARTYAQVFAEAARFGGLLRKRGVLQGDRVVVAIPNSAEFFAVFYGILSVGAVAVPVFPGSGPARVLRIAELCGAGHVVVASFFEAERLTEYGALCQEKGAALVRGDEAGDCEPLQELPTIGRGDLAFLQYTSGSTGDPKGVMLTHGGLLENVDHLVGGFKVTSRDSFASWLPVYHDLGLIVMTIVPFAMGCPLHLLPTSFSRIPDWLRTVAEQRCTFIAAPDFAYRLSLRYVRDPETYDLSSLRVALNAAEPVRAPTIRLFEEAFGLRNVMCPAYGLAEATVGVSNWHPGQPVAVDGRGLVSVGPPMPGIVVKIVEDGRELAPGEVGEIAVQSAANCRGYFGNPEATRELFLDEDTILTGDMGYLDERGHLFISGRKKNVILAAGRTIANQEVEETVDAHPAVRQSAAVGIDRGGVEGEQVYIFAEVQGASSQSEERMEEIGVEIVERFHDSLGFRPGRVYLVHRRTLPRTYNGKIQHAKLRERYLSGELRREGAILHPDY